MGKVVERRASCCWKDIFSIVVNWVDSESKGECGGKTVGDRGTTEEHAKEQFARRHGVYSSKRPLVSLVSFEVGVVLMAKGIAVQKGEGGGGDVLVHGEEVGESKRGVVVVEYLEDMLETF